MTRRVLVLGGTQEGRRLATALEARGVPVVSSLAGRLREPRLPPGDVHVGGFGGPAELAAWLRQEKITQVVDATHPFAARITVNAAAAAKEAGVNLVVLRRTGWTEQPGDHWIRVPSQEAAARALDDVGDRVLLTTGRQGLDAFATRPEWFLVRVVETPQGPLPARAELLLERGPFDVAHETELLRQHDIRAIVTKDSGGDATSAKLTAARSAKTPVIVVDRPPLPEGVDKVDSVGAALEHLRI